MSSLSAMQQAGLRLIEDAEKKKARELARLQTAIEEEEAVQEQQLAQQMKSLEEQRHVLLQAAEEDSKAKHEEMARRLAEEEHRTQLLHHELTLKNQQQTQAIKDLTEKKIIEQRKTQRRLEQEARDAQLHGAQQLQHIKANPALVLDEGVTCVVCFDDTQLKQGIRCRGSLQGSG